MGVVGSDLAAGTAIGAAAGWAIGASIGSLVEQSMLGQPAPPNALTDLSVQTSAWGTGIPQIFGTQRVSGNIFWSTDKRLVGGSTGKWGGKGGGGGKSGKKGPQEGYYVVDLALALCEGPIAGIKRIWAGGNLIFDDSSPVFVPSMDPSNPGSGSYQQMYATNGPVSTTGGSALGSWTLYHGTGLQDADPTIVANGSSNGDGGVPYQSTTFGNNSDYTYAYGSPSFGKLGTACAYRGLAYIVFEGLNIGYGGSIPPLSFEVVAAPSSYEGMSVIAGPFGLDSNPAGARPDWFPGLAVYNDGDAILLGNGSVVNTYTGQATPGFSAGNGGDTAWVPIQQPGTTLVQYVTAGYWGDYQNQGALEIQAVDEGRGYYYPARIDQLGFFPAPVNGQAFGANATYAGGQLWVWDGLHSFWNIGIRNYSESFTIDAGYTPVNPPGQFQPFLTIGNALYYLALSNAQYYLVALDGPTGNVTASPVASTHVGTGSLLCTDGTHVTAVSPLSSGSSVITTLSTSGQVLAEVTTAAAIGEAGSSVDYYDDGNGGCVYGAEGSTLSKIRYTDGSVLSQFALPSSITSPLVRVVKQGILVIGGGSYVLTTFGNNTIVPGATTLQSALTSICERAGFSSVDTSLVSGSLTVNFTRKAGSAARDQLKILSTAYSMDMVDSGGVLRFVPKGQGIAAQLSLDDMGYGKIQPSGVPGSPWTRSRVQDPDLPRSVVVKYTSSLATYNPYSAMAQVHFDAGKDVSVNLPLTLDDLTAQNLALYLCAAPHIEREAVSWTSPLHWIWLEPGDVVQLPDGGAYRITKVAVRDAQKEPVVDFMAVNDASYVMASGAGQAGVMPGRVLAQSAQPLAALPVGGPGSFLVNNPVAGGVNSGQAVPTKPMPNPGVAAAMYFEVPPLDSSDTTPKLYIAPWTTGNVFMGAVVYQSTDGGSTFSKIATQMQDSVVGAVYAAMPATQAVTWDMATTVDVYLKSSLMSLQGATDQQVFAGANYALIGSELVQFANANAMVDTSGRTFYRLSRLLRGRRGTEWAMTTHAAQEAFVLVDPRALEDSLVPYTLNALNASYAYKVGTAGQSADAVLGTTYAIQGVWYRPFAPVHPQLSSDASGDWTLSFTPRARLLGFWGSGYTASLDADTQSWSADVVVGGKVLRTLTGPLSSPTLTYTAAQQTADGLTPGQHGITLQVYEVQSNVGRGTPLTVTT
jgi:hypothetical protein